MAPFLHLKLLWRMLREETQSLETPLTLFWLSLLFCIFFCSFVYVVLIAGRVETPGVFWDAVKTNYVAGLLSQLSAILTCAAMKALLGVLRNALARRPQGSSFATWAGLGGSDWLTVLQVAFVDGFMNLWCDLRLSLPIMSLAFGSIVKFQADFVYYFVPSDKVMPVYSGLVAPEAGLLSLVEAADVAMFCLTWSSSLLTNPMFAVDFPMDNCTENCRSVLMPGGLTIARQAKPFLNESVYFGDVFKELDTIRIHNATGMVVKYEAPDQDSLVFDIPTECIYTGSQMKNGLQVCARQVGPSVLFGWSACPKSIYDREQCDFDQSWRMEPLSSSTLMSLYTIPTTTSYSVESQNILSIDTDPKPSQITILARDYLQILDHILVPAALNVTTGQTEKQLRDANNINSLVYSITWMHRTFLKSFPSDRTSATSMLHNLLAVPIQFSVTARTYANYSQSLYEVPLPETMRTTATGGKSSSRLKIQPWAGWLFIASDIAVHVGMAAGIVWILFWRKGDELPAESAIKEFEIVREAERMDILSPPVPDTGSWLWRFCRSSITWLRCGNKPRWEPSDEAAGRLDRTPLVRFSLAEATFGNASAWKLAKEYRGYRILPSGATAPVPKPEWANHPSGRRNPENEADPEKGMDDKRWEQGKSDKVSTTSLETRTSYIGSVASLEDNSSFETQSDVSVVSPALDANRQQIVNDLMAEFTNILDQNLGIRTCLASQSQIQAGGSSSGQRRSSDGSNQGRGSGKRPKTAGGRKEDPGDEGPENDVTAPAKVSTTEIIDQRLACPYFQRDPQKHRAVRSCAGPGWPTIHRLKEHIYRRHRLAALNLCTRCGEQFRSQDEWLAHSRLPDPCTVVAFELHWCNQDQERQLRSRQPATGSIEDKWRAVYKILFPQDDDDDIPSPYYTTENLPWEVGRERVLTEYERYLRRELPRAVQQRIEQVAAELSAPLASELRARLHDIIHSEQHALSRQYLGTCVPPNSLNANTSLSMPIPDAGSCINVTDNLQQASLVSGSIIEVVPDLQFDFSSLLTTHESFAAVYGRFPRPDVEFSHQNFGEREDSAHEQPEHLENVHDSGYGASLHTVDTDHEIEREYCSHLYTDENPSGLGHGGKMMDWATDTVGRTG